MEAQTSEESTRLTLTGLDGVRNKSSLMRGPKRALYISLRGGKGVKGEGLLSKRWKQEVE